MGCTPTEGPELFSSCLLIMFPIWVLPVEAEAAWEKAPPQASTGAFLGRARGALRPRDARRVRESRMVDAVVGYQSCCLSRRLQPPAAGPAMAA